MRKCLRFADFCSRLTRATSKTATKRQAGLRALQISGSEDVDLPGSTSIEFFDIHNNSIFSQAVLPGTVPNGSFSFLGIANAVEQIFHVRITSGNAPIGPNTEAGGVDLVAMDDFFHAEPQSVPESGAGIGLIGLVLGFMLLCYRRFVPVS